VWSFGILFLSFVCLFNVLLFLQVIAPFVLVLAFWHIFIRYNNPCPLTASSIHNPLIFTPRLMHILLSLFTSDRAICAAPGVLPHLTVPSTIIRTEPLKYVS